jgi:hypothetical protein
MNVTALRFNVIPILLGVIGLITAFVLGIFIGGGEIVNLSVIFGALILISVIAGMRQYVWLLIPMLWGLTGSIAILPIPFSVRDLAVMVVAALSFALLALRIYRFRNKWGLLDFLLLLNVSQVGLAFILHPTGLRALSSSTIGSRPYFNIAIAAVAYVVLSNQVIPATLARRVPVLMLIPEAITSMISLLVHLKPSLGYALGRVYTGFFPQLLSSIGPQVQRINIGTGTTLSTALVSYYRPLSLLTPLKPFRSLAFLIALVLVLISGFRSQLIMIGAIFILASYFHRGLSEALTVMAGMFFALLAVILINATILPLPLPVQRTLSFLPGRWDTRAKKDAEASTEWRLEMWKEVAKGGPYIRDKVWGDGFGFSRTELAALAQAEYLTAQAQQEYFMIIGAFHNGPLSAIRFVGVVGLTLYYALLIYCAVFAVHLIRLAQGSSLSALAFFIGLPLIWEPLNYTFVFGGYDSGLPNTIFAVGMLKMIANSIPEKSRDKKLSIKSQRPAQTPRSQVALT